METEVVARITWGDTPSDVRAWLMSQEMSKEDADRLVQDCWQRRGGEMRLLGVRDLVWGIPSLIGALLLAGGGIMGLDWIVRQGVRVPVGAYALIFAPSFLVGGYGCWRSLRGLDRLVFGSRADGAVTDVE